MITPLPAVPAFPISIYNVSLAKCCQMIANVEWIFSGPNQVTGLRNRDMIVPGLQALILF